MPININKTILKLNTSIPTNKLNHTTKTFKDGTLKVWDLAYEFVLSTIDQPQVTQMYGFDFSRTFNNKKLCSSPITYHPTEGNFSRNCNYIYNSSFQINFSDLILWTTYQQYKEIEILSYCNSFHLHSNCKLEKLNKNQYTVTTNKSISVTIQKNKTIVYPYNLYVPTNDGIFICANNNKPNKATEYSWLERVNMVQQYISMVGTSISVLFHLFFIITYTLFKYLHNKGGRNVFGIVCSLLFSDILFLIATGLSDHQNACRTVAILLHWTLFIDHTWAVIIAADILSHFLRKSVNQNTGTRKRFLWYIFASIVPSSIIIITTATLDETNVFVFDYGRDGICWIGSFYAMLIFYMIPVVIGYMFSIGCLSCVIIYLRRNNKQNNKALGKNTNIHLSKIALKLVIVLGISEIIGFIQIYGSNLSENEQIFNTVFSFLYNIARSFPRHPYLHNIFME